MTDQEAYDTVCAHLLGQRRRSELDDNGKPQCLLRGPEGLRCALGALVPDDQYSPSLEGRSAEELSHSVPALRGLSPWLLEELLQVHDLYEPHEWPGRLRRISALAERDGIILCLPPCLL